MLRLKIKAKTIQLKIKQTKEKALSTLKHWKTLKDILIISYMIKEPI
jgi:hypothetical protein